MIWNLLCSWSPGGGGGGCTQQELTQQNPDPVQDTKDVNFATLSKRKCCNFLPCSRLDQAGHIQNTTNGTQVCVFTHSNEGTRNQRKLCDRRGRKGENLRGWPCLRHENVKLYTLFKTEDPENDTLTVVTLYKKYMGVRPPPPPPPPPRVLVLFLWWPSANRQINLFICCTPGILT